MIIGMVKETKPEEYRIPLTPSFVEKMTRQNHKFRIQKDAGKGAGYPDAVYVAAGAEIADSAEETVRHSDIVLKVKEPVENEYEIFRTGQTLFCYLHSETRPRLVDMLLDKKITAIAFENVRYSDGFCPLLSPMSIIAGQQAVLQGMQFLWNHNGGVGKSIVGYPGLEPAQIVVFGAGQAGYHAARIAARLGAKTTVFEIDRRRIRSLAGNLPENIDLFHTDAVSPEPYVCAADMVINTATIPPRSDVHLIDRKVISKMKKGSIIVDVTANLEGAVETIDRYTTHDNPVWEVDGVIHYAVTNIPGAVAQTASQALALEVFPFLNELASKGVRKALQETPALLNGLTSIDGVLTWKEAGVYQHRPWRTPETVL